MPKEQRFFECYDAAPLDVRVMDDTGQAAWVGGSPVSVCICADGETPEEGIARVQKLLEYALYDDQGPMGIPVAKIEPVADGHVRIILFKDPVTKESIIIEFNVGNLGLNDDRTNQTGEPIN